MLSRQSKSRTNLRKNNRGVTLIEVIAVVAVMSIVMAAVTGFIITGSKMSANVSGHAKDSMQEQTAVEYINRWIWAADTVTADEDSILLIEVPEWWNSEKCYTKLSLGTTVGFLTFIPKSESNAEAIVIYNKGNSDEYIELCTGEIYFEEITNNTVTYYLNGEKHVVHLRAGKIVSENE